MGVNQSIFNKQLAQSYPIILLLTHVIPGTWMQTTESDMNAEKEPQQWM